MTKRVVIVGGGFAGLSAARTLSDELKVTLIDRQADFEFLPSIHEIISRRQSVRSVRLPRGRVLHELGHRSLVGAVERIDLHRQEVEWSGGREPYDALILAPGGEQPLDVIPGVADHAAPFRSAADAERVAERLEHLAHAGRPARVVVVGGGLTGVEVLGEILRKHRKRHFLDLALVEPSERLLPGWPKVLHRRIEKRCERHGVELIFGAKVSAVEADRVHLDNGRCLASSLTIWCAGTRPPGFLARSGLGSGLTGRGRGVLVDAALRVPAFPEVFLAGDAALPPGKVKKQAAQALLLGERAAKNARRVLRGKEPRPFVKEPLPVLLTFGDLATFVIFDDDRVLEGEVLAAGRDLSFGLGMAEFDRLGTEGSLGRLERRLRHEKALERLEREPWRLAEGVLGLTLHGS